MMVSTKAMISHTMCGLDKVTMGCLVFEAALLLFLNLLLVLEELLQKLLFL